jgi:hypothetical protein
MLGVNRNTRGLTHEGKRYVNSGRNYRQDSNRNPVIRNTSTVLEPSFVEKTNVKENVAAFGENTVDNGESSRNMESRDSRRHTNSRTHRHHSHHSHSRRHSHSRHHSHSRSHSNTRINSRKP